MLFVPMTTTDQWTAELATRWRIASGFPPEIGELLATSPSTFGAKPLLAIPEHQVRLRGGTKAAPTDLWVLARTRRGLLSIAIDGQSSFGPTVEEWQANAAPQKTDRWAALCRLLEVNTVCAPSIRYQLFHRTASALIEARRFFATGAAVIVHSLAAAPGSFADFQRFVALMGGRLTRPGELIPVPSREGIELLFGWAQT
jgi:hypothetical protein